MPNDDAPNLLDALLDTDQEGITEAVREIARRANVDPLRARITLTLDAEGIAWVSLQAIIDGSRTNSGADESMTEAIASIRCVAGD